MMVQRFGVVLLAMVVFVGCGGGDEPDIDEAPKTRITWEKDGARMELIPAGYFQMGSTGEVFFQGLRRRYPYYFHAGYQISAIMSITSGILSAGGRGKSWSWISN